MNDYIIKILIVKENRVTEFKVQENNFYQAFLSAKSIQEVFKFQWKMKTEIIGVEKNIMSHGKQWKDI